MLSTNELLAILLGALYVADADHILVQTQGFPGLAQLTFAELPAVAEPTSVRIKVVSKPSRHLLVTAPAECPTVRSPAGAATHSSGVRARHHAHLSLDIDNAANPHGPAEQRIASKNTARAMRQSLRLRRRPAST